VAPLEGRLRQSLREHVAGTLMSYLALRQTAMQQADGARFPPRFPSRLRPEETAAAQNEALGELARLADNLSRERQLVAVLQQTRQAEVVSIPFVGVDARYGCGLYFNRQTQRFYARLDVVGSKSRYGRPITARGEYIDTKTGVIYRSAPVAPEAAPSHPALGESSAASHASSAVLPAASPITSFGHGKKSVFAPLEMGRYHESALRYAPVAFLPQRGVDRSRPAPATPMAAHLVRRRDPKRDGGVRPLLANHRGIRRLYAAVLTDAEATAVQRMAFRLGAELQAIQVAHEQARRERQRRGAPTRGDRRQGHIAKHHIALLANEIVALARQEHVQIVLEDLAAFGAPGGVRALTRATQPAAHARAQRAMLTRRQFAALQQALDTRLEVLGLPLARTVNAAYISRDCPQCGARQERVPSERPDWFVCATCAFSDDRDLVANVARKFVWLRHRGEQKKAGVAPEARERHWRSVPARPAAGASLSDLLLRGRREGALAGTLRPQTLRALRCTWGVAWRRTRPFDGN
jgi:hypothetical protein